MLQCISGTSAKKLHSNYLASNCCTQQGGGGYGAAAKVWRAQTNLAQNWFFDHVIIEVDTSLDLGLVQLEPGCFTLK